MKARKAALAALLVIYVVFWVGGVVSYGLTGGVAPGTEWAAPVFLLVAGLIVAVSASAAEWPVVAAAALFGFGSEVIGVRYGWPFGAYQYTDVLAPKLWGVPLVIVCAWLVLAAYVRPMAARLGGGRAASVVVAAAWMTAIDLVIDPLAANHLGYWRWESSGAYYGIPATNFAGWFAVSLLIFALDRRLTREARASGWAVFTGLSILLFFTLIALAAKLFLAAAVGFLLLLVHAALAGPLAQLRAVAVKG
jgi:uncharacterized membrane protein